MKTQREVIVEVEVDLPNTVSKTNRELDPLTRRKENVAAAVRRATELGHQAELNQLLYNVKCDWKETRK